MQFFKGSHRGVSLLLILAVLYCVFYIQVQNSSDTLGGRALELSNSITGSVVESFVFFLFQVVIPEAKKKQLIKQNFERQWVKFKLEFIRVFLLSSECFWQVCYPDT